ncbi:MFS transporter [Pandoraea nosoerga]|uniref:MFS transporter n=1 Tax=Pandoraea nosoerga TaxID=2508296 RepID=A0A5E4W038_9BURK|nr:MFS transporter [Pandoraea nosoerga]VVE18058.1 MFS transporter [Pandoraea nosoerga]
MEQQQALVVPGQHSQAIASEPLRVISLVAAGSILETYEFTVFIFLAPWISSTMFPAGVEAWVLQMQVLAVFAVGYLARPLGGIVIANIGDMIGRKRVFAFTLTLMALPTVVIGLLPGYATVGVWAPVLLILMRLLQGIAFGGEVPGACVFVGEHVAERRVGLAVGLIGGGMAFGIFLGVVTINLIMGSMEKADVAEYGWRIPFIVGGAFGLIAGYLRRYVHETPVFQELKAKQGVAREMPIKRLLRDYRKEVLLCVMLCVISATIVPNAILYAPVYMRTYMGMSNQFVGHIAMLAVLGLTIGCIVGGCLIDRFGPKKVTVAYCIGGTVSTYAFYLTMQSGPEGLQYLYPVVGFFAGAICLPYYALIYSFDAPVRYSGISLAYNIPNSLLGGVTPVLLGWLTVHDRLAPAHYQFICLLVGAIAVPMVWRLRKPLHI